MSLIGVSPKDIARHVGWKSLQTAEYYMQTGKVMKMSHAASALADSTSTVKGGSSAAISQWQIYFASKTKGEVFLSPFLRSLYVLERVLLNLCHDVSFVFPVRLL